MPKKSHSSKRSADTKINVSKKELQSKDNGRKVLKQVKVQGHSYDLRSRGDAVNPKVQKTSVTTTSKSTSAKVIKGKTTRSKTVLTHTIHTQSSSKHSKSRPEKKTTRRRRPVSVSICSRARSSSPSPSRTDASNNSNIVKMYTFVPKAKKEEHQPRGDRPSMQIIDHRKRQALIDNRIMARSLPTEDSALEIVMDQRNALFDAELGYKRRIKALEKEGEEMAVALEQSLAENRSLKNNINRAPGRSEVKKLTQEKKTLQDVIEKLGEENFELNELLNRVLKKSEEEWQDVLENVRRRQEERYAVIGPFISRIQGLKKRTVTMNDGPEVHKDSYDIHLTSIEKETQSLLHKLRQLKREKRVIDYSLVTGERRCFQNRKKFNEIGENLNRDLNKHTSQLGKLTVKYGEIIDSLQESKGLQNKAVQTEDEPKPEPEIQDIKERKKKSTKKLTEKLSPLQDKSKSPFVKNESSTENTGTLPNINNASDRSVARQRTVIKMTEKSTNAAGKNVANKSPNEFISKATGTNNTKSKPSIKNISSSDKSEENQDPKHSKSKVPKKKEKQNGLTDTDKDLTKTKPQRKPPDNSGSFNMSSLVSPALGKAPHR